MRIALTGASGLIGSHLAASLRDDGHEVLTLVRRPTRQPGEVTWDPATGRVDPAKLAGVEAAVHLAGAGIGDKRWTESYKREVLRSRVDGTRLIATTLALLEPLPRVLLSGSAIGFYGNTGSRPVDEESSAGAGFLADVCVAWEAATEPAERAGLRVCHLRTGIVLSAAGGALRKQLPLYRAGLGGPLGSGEQYQSWVSLADDISAITWLLSADDVSGPVNITAPEPVTQAEFAHVLGAAMHRPSVLPTPAFALRLALGGFADEGVLAGQRVLPTVLTKGGFAFHQPTLLEGITAALDAHAH